MLCTSAASLLVNVLERVCRKYSRVHSVLRSCGVFPRRFSIAMDVDGWKWKTEHEMMRNAWWNQWERKEITARRAEGNKVEKVAVYLLPLHVEACHGGDDSADDWSSAAVFAFRRSRWFLPAVYFCWKSFNSCYSLVIIFTTSCISLFIHQQRLDLLFECVGLFITLM